MPFVIIDHATWHQLSRYIQDPGQVTNRHRYISTILFELPGAASTLDRHIYCCIPCNAKTFIRRPPLRLVFDTILCTYRTADMLPQSNSSVVLVFYCHLQHYLLQQDINICQKTVASSHCWLTRQPAKYVALDWSPLGARCPQHL